MTQMTPIVHLIRYSDKAHALCGTTDIGESCGVNHFHEHVLKHCGKGECCEQIMHRICPPCLEAYTQQADVRPY